MNAKKKKKINKKNELKKSYNYQVELQRFFI